MQIIFLRTKQIEPVIFFFLRNSRVVFLAEKIPTQIIAVILEL